MVTARMLILPFRRSLKARITLATLAIFLGCLWALSFYASQILRKDMERLLGEQQLSTVATVAAQVNHELENRLNALKNVAALSAPPLLEGPQAMQAFLDQRHDLHVLFNGGAYVTDIKGTAIADFPLSSARAGGNYLDREYIAVPLKEDRAIIGQPVIGKKARVPVVVMGAPIHDAQGKVVGALGGVINLDIPSFLDQITDNSYGKTGGYLLTAPQYRLIVTATDKRRVMETLPAPGEFPLIDQFIQGYEGSGVFVNPQGLEVLASAKGVPVAGWYVAAMLPTTELFAPLDDMQQRLSLATIVLTLLAAALTWWMLRRQFSPLLSTAKALADMSNTRQTLCPLLIARQDEIGLLVGGFNRLLTTLGRREEALKESEESLAITLYSIGDAVIATDVQGRVTRMNPTAERLTAWSQADAKNRLLTEVFCIVNAATREPVADPVQQVMALGQTVGLANHTLLLARDGCEYQIADSAAPMRNAADEIVGVVLVFSDVTEKYRMEEALREGHEILSSILDATQDGYWRINAQGQLLDVNPAYCRLSGYTAQELLTKSVSDLDSEKDQALIVAHIRVILDGGNEQFETRHRRKDGSIWHVEVSAICRNQASGEIFVFLRDITERKKNEEKLHLAASVFTHAREGILITDMDATIIDVNDSFTRITGFSHDEIVGKNPSILGSGLQDKAFYAAMWRDLLEKDHWYGEVWNRRKNGDVYAEMLTISAVGESKGNARHYVALFSDITALKEHEKQLERLAHYDVLTTLPNRVLLADRLLQGMIQAERRGQLLAVAYLDLDEFKAVNDRYGHEVGDQLLIALSSRMKQALREGDTLARIGGDEFVAVLFDLADISASVPMISRLLAAAAQPVRVGDLDLQVSASLGVTFYPQAEEVDADHLLRQADQAMYQAKLSGKNRYHIFDAEQDRSVRGHHESIEHIRRALREREFVLHYQPKVNMRTGSVIGAEALIRWQHPERGLLAPGVFLPVIEDHLLSIEIGEWVVTTALKQRERWQEEGLDIPVSVNIGARQLQQGEFVSRLKAILAAHPATKSGDLELEVLETSALEDLDRVSRVIEECQSIGVSFALDDFGTGYSSLTYLKRLSVNQLKIDQSFVRDMLNDPDDLAILGGVLSLATAFRRQVIAEGVETVEHGAMLLQLGCELAQGYGIARPMPGEMIPAWAAAWLPDTVWSTLPSVNRDDLPVLFSGVEHSAWIVAIGSFLRGERNSLPLIHHQCSFGAWLESDGAHRHHGRPILRDVEIVHRQLHEAVNALLALHALGHCEQALSGLHELHELQESLLEKSRVLVQESV